jgi:hypothetical protein
MTNIPELLYLPGLDRLCFMFSHAKFKALRAGGRSMTLEQAIQVTLG